MPILGNNVGIECYGCDGSTPPCDATNHGYVFYCSNTDYCEVIYAGTCIRYISFPRICGLHGLFELVNSLLVIH